MPAWSVARTSKLWLPAPSAARVCGLVQELQLPPSTRHSNVEPVSEELKLKFGVVLLDGSAGLESMVVFGAVLSTRRLAARLVFELPALSVATTRRS